jgi:two-component system alkaline phosphatase synthesis response regulator PhoP
MHILVAEDDPDIANLIARYLQKAGWTTHVVSSGTEALAAARDRNVDVAVLDIMLPELSGLDLCRILRREPATSTLPIIMVTARADESDRIMGLDLGADDYLSKPFSPNELVARVRALIRRARASQPHEGALTYGPLAVDLSRHTVTLDGQDIKLTAKEFLLLEYVLRHQGRVLSRDRLLADVWGYNYTGGTRTVDVHVRRLREKLPVLVDALVTVTQFGYKLVEESDRAHTKPAP